MGNMEENIKNLNKRISSYCADFIYVALIAIPFVSSFSSALVNVFIGFAIFAYLLKKIANKEFLPVKTPINLPYPFLILISLFSFANSVSLSASMGGIGKLIKYGFLFLIIAEGLKDEKHLKKIIIALIAGLYLASLDGLFQLYFGKDLFRAKPYDFVIGLARLKATFPHTNIFAAYLALFLPICVSLVLYYLKGKRKILLGLMSLLIIYCLIFTFSRGAIFGFGFAVLLMSIIKKDKLIIALLIIILIMTPFILPKNIKEWIKTTDSLWEVLLNKARLNIYRTSLNMIKAHPFIGVGVNTYCLNYQKYKVKETYGFTADARYYAHNNFLHMVAEIGLIGFAAFLWLLIVFFGSWIRFYKSSDSNFLKICGLGIVTGIIAFLVNGLTETNLYYSKVATLFWYQVGLFLGISGIKVKEKENG